MDFSFLDWAKNLINIFGYAGLLLVNLAGSATVFFPLPAATIVFVSGAVLNPVFVGLFSAAGCAIGETIGYALGFGGKKIAEKRYEKMIKRGTEWFQKGRAFWLIIIFAATPLPDDVVGILAGMFNYNIRKFILASFLGKLIMNLALAFGGFYGVSWILKLFNFNI